MHPFNEKIIMTNSILLTFDFVLVASNENFLASKCTMAATFHVRHFNHKVSIVEIGARATHFAFCAASIDGKFKL